MSKLPVITASLLAVSMITGCSIISAVDNARSGYQATQALKMAKGMSDAQPVFHDTSAFNVTANLMPRDETIAAEVEQVFVQLAIEETLATANKFDLDLRHCEINCPTDAVIIQFNEKGRDGFVEKIAMGRAIGGDLYLTQSGRILEQVPLDMADDYAGVAQNLATTINVRLMKTVQTNIMDNYNSGKITESEMKAKSESLAAFFNGNVQSIESSLLEKLKGKN